MIRLGLRIPDLSPPGAAGDGWFERMAAVAATAETSGFDSVWVTDHLRWHSLPGEPDTGVLVEPYTLLAALATRTTTARLGALVTGVTHRNPAVLAKQVTTLDVISGGRAVLGLVTYQATQEGSGVPPVGEDTDAVQEAILICRAMFRDERPSFAGRHHRITDAFNRPPPVQAGGPPILMAIGDEEGTLELAARHADAVSLVTGAEEIPRRLEALARNCVEAGRDPQTINKTCLGSAVVGRTTAEAEATGGAMAAGRDPGGAAAGAMGAFLVCGTPDAIAASVVEIMAPGLDGVLLDFPANADDAGAVAAVGEAIGAARRP